MAASSEHDQRERPGAAPVSRVAGRCPCPSMANSRGEDADHEDLGVGEVDEPQHAVDERVAEGDQGVDRAERQPVDRLGPELVDEVS